jgi:hypothetical protein
MEISSVGASGERMLNEHQRPFESLESIGGFHKDIDECPSSEFLGQTVA